MDDQRLRLLLRVIDTPAQPDPAFVELLHRRLAAELGLQAAGAVTTVPRLAARAGRRSPLPGWAVVAALVVVAGGAYVVGAISQDPEPPPSPAPATISPAPTPSVSPAPSTSPAAPASLAPSLDALRGDGLVVFEVATLDEPARLRILQPDLSSVELVPEQAGLQTRAAWDPLGERLAYTHIDPTDPALSSRVWDVAADGGEPRLLSEDCAPPDCLGETDPAFSPDGQRLAVVRTRADGDGGRESVLVIREVVSGAVTELEATTRDRAEAENLHPRWSPDGGSIAYGVTVFGPDGLSAGSTIRIASADGSNDRQLTDPELEAGDPEWAPDGSRLLFSSQPIRSYAAAVNRNAGRMHLYTMAASGGDVREFGLVGPVGAATWTAGGDQVLFTYLEGAGERSPGVARLFVMDADGGNVRPVTGAVGTNAWYAVQQPGPPAR